MLVIIDYGVGNLTSVFNAFKHITNDVIVTDDKEKIKNASHILLPGVGAFGKAMENLQKRDFISLIYEEINKGKPFMGICLGMQLLMSESNEMGNFKGLDIIKGKVLKFEEKGYKIPQIGWNNVKNNNSLLFSGIKDMSMFYFVHSYYVLPEKPQVVAGETEYNDLTYCSAIEYNNIFATQFHPEKSGDDGLNVLRNFLKIK